MMMARTDQSRGDIYMFFGLRDTILVASGCIQIAMSHALRETLASHNQAWPTLMAIFVGACRNMFLNTNI